jgi:hypothetical protein
MKQWPSYIAMIATAVLALVAEPACAETATEVQSWCKPVANASVDPDGMVDVGNTFDRVFCWGAFAAIQGLSRLVPDDGTPLLLFCAPPTSNRLQYIQIFERYAEQHPEKGHLDFTVVARNALAQAFPCTAKPN